MPSDVISPFHAGERDVQARLGVRGIEDWARRIVRPYMPEQHRAFHTALPFLVVAARDAGGRPWATLLTGPDGFVTAPDPQSLVIAAQPVAGDALAGRLVAGADIGILGIELATRRRNRVNGRISSDGDGAIVFAVDQSFGNCPQYIRERQWRRVDGVAAGTPVRTSRLTPSQRRLITAADTFFIASGHRGDGDSPAFGMDASHRGGDRGFISVASDTHLVFPDYAGNNLYNTIGNLVQDPRAGLLFVDFETGGLLQITGRASVDWDSDAVAGVPGARRLVIFDIGDVVELPSAVPLRWDADAGTARALRLIEKTRASDDVVSFVFEARDGGPLPPFEAGQYLPIELGTPGLGESVRRSYSLSGTPEADTYRISVKRAPRGIASRYLHDHAEPGAIIVAGKPAGDFLLPDDTHPVVLVSAGIGVTPMVSMLHALAMAGDGRAVWFVHGARDGGRHPLNGEVRELAKRRPGIRVHVVYSQPRAEDEADGVGRLDGALLGGLVGDIDAHYLLCGPTGFMADIQSGLEDRGVPVERIHIETFGPVAG